MTCKNSKFGMGSPSGQLMLTLETGWFILIAGLLGSELGLWESGQAWFGQPSSTAGLKDSREWRADTGDLINVVTLGSAAHLSPAHPEVPTSSLVSIV